MKKWLSALTAYLYDWIETLNVVFENTMTVKNIDTCRAFLPKVFICMNFSLSINFITLKYLSTGLFYIHIEDNRYSLITIR